MAEHNTGLRESVNRHPKTVIAAIGLMVLVAVGFTVQQQRPPGMNPPKYAYFSDDDGKTFFKDAATLVPPFDHGGKQAVAAYVFSGTDGKPFVAYLERAIGGEGRAKVEQARRDLMTRAMQQAVPMPDSELMELINRNLEVKRPGDRAWVGATDPRAGPIMSVTVGDAGAPAAPVQP